jgi:hypothetical protein
MKRKLTTLVALSLATTALAWLRVSYEDATIVERSELIVVGHLDVSSIEYVPHSVEPSGGRSWEHHAKLVITEVIKGTCEANEIPIIIHYGLTPLVGGYVKRDGFMIDRRFGRTDCPTNKVEIIDTGNSVIGHEPIVEVAGQDNLWFLRRRGGVYGREPSAGNLGIVDPEDLQPLKLREYFLCYLSDHPEQAVREYVAGHPELAGRAQRYFDHLDLQRILKTPDPGARFDGLLPYYLKGQTWDNKAEARIGIVSCGRVAGEKLLSLFRDPSHKDRRQDIILLWRDVNYTSAAPLLISLLEESDRFWAQQHLTKGWWNDNTDPQLAQKRKAIYGEVYYAVAALRGFQDPRAREAIELTKRRWETIGFENPQIVEECDAALKALSEQ